jgi:hypothetical protein
LDPMVITIGDVCPGAVRGNGNGRRPIKLAVAGSIRTPLTEKRAYWRKILDAVVSSVGYVNFVAWAVRQALGVVELAVATSAGAPLPEKRTARREVLYPIVLPIRYVNGAVRGDVDLEGKHELAVAGAV